MMHGHEKSDLVIVAVKPANKARNAHCGDVCGGRRSGVGGAKDGGQGEYAQAKHALDTEPGSRDERSDIAGAEGLYSLEGNMCGTATRGADALPGSKATSRAKGSYRNLGGLASGRRCRVMCVEYGGPHREGEEP